MTHRPRIALVLDPRFMGGTASAVAREIRALRPLADLSVHAVTTSIFKPGAPVNPALAAALVETGLTMAWDEPIVRADTVVFHNPAALKFGGGLKTRFLCQRLIVVTHENFLRPGGALGFDVEETLNALAAASVTGARLLAPVSAYNREGVEAWLACAPAPFPQNWRMAADDWNNICDFDFIEPVAAPRDRRGRMSRPGFEKFPDLAAMNRHFPPHAERCALLGANSFLADPASMPEHWEALPFGAQPVEAFLKTIDFFVYFTHPLWRESFGRVIAEAIAAGKVVITDPGTAKVFDGLVVASSGDDVDAIIAGFVDDPNAYAAFVRNAQRGLEQFSSSAVAGRILSLIARSPSHALL